MGKADSAMGASAGVMNRAVPLQHQPSFGQSNMGQTGIPNQGAGPSSFASPGAMQAWNNGTAPQMPQGMMGMFQKMFGSGMMDSMGQAGLTRPGMGQDMGLGQGVLPWMNARGGNQPTVGPNGQPLGGDLNGFTSNDNRFGMGGGYGPSAFAMKQPSQQPDATTGGNNAGNRFWF